jgi:hypothetical protein
VLHVERLSVLDLLDPAEINKCASIVAPSDDEFENVLVVDGSVAATEPLLRNQDVKEILKFKKTFLKRLRPHLHAAACGSWSRFAMVKVDSRDGTAMYPRLLPGATVLIDRHYNSLDPYRKGEPNMYAVRSSSGCTVRYVEVAGRALVLRPHNQDSLSKLFPWSRTPRSPITSFGRICHVSIEVSRCVFG